MLLSGPVLAYMSEALGSSPGTSPTQKGEHSNHCALDG